MQNAGFDKISANGEIPYGHDWELLLFPPGWGECDPIKSARMS